MEFPQPEVTVLDLANQLTPNQEAKLDRQLKQLEADTGWKLRVLTQADKSPGRQVKDYWGLNEKSVLMVANPRGGNLLAFNVGDRVREVLPRTFWIELQSRYGNQFFVRDNGNADAIQTTVSALDGCFREGGCRVVPGLPDEHWVLTLAMSVAGGLICGFAGKPRKENEIFRWQWALLFAPLWLTLFGAFGIGPVVSRTADWLPITRNVLAFLASVLAIYVLPITPFGRDAEVEES
nr:TPM domain-containing protein [Synechococcus sp. PCC 7336]